MGSDVAEKAPVNKPGYVKRSDVLAIGAIYLQWALIYVYYMFYPTTYAPNTDYHELLNLCIVASYQVIILAAWTIFKGKVGYLGANVMPGIAFLLYELDGFAYIVIGMEWLAKGSVEPEFAQQRFIDKQNILAGYMSMLSVAGAYLCFKYRVGVARKLGTMIAFAFLLVLSIYHITLYFHEFEPMAKELEEIREEGLRPMVFTRDLEADCKRLPRLECYRFMEGEEWPEGARLEGSEYLTLKEKDYYNGWPQLLEEIRFRTGNEEITPEEIIWTETQRAANFDDTFVPQYDALIVFSKYKNEITVFLYRHIITRVLDVSERASGAIMMFCTFWVGMSLLVIWTHPNRDEKGIRVRGAFIFWNIAGCIAFMYYFNLFFHAALLFLALLMIHFHKWRWLLFMVLSYLVFAGQVWLFLTLIKGTLGDVPLAIFSAVIGLILGGVSMKLGAPVSGWRARSLWLLLAVLAVEMPMMFKDAVISPFGWTPGILLGMAVVCLVAAKKEPERLFSGFYMLMAGLISSAMYLWLGTGLLMDGIEYGREIGWENPINNVLANTNAVLFYFSFLVGGCALYLQAKHKGVLEALGRRLAKARQE